jgi:hypothetical protein
MRTNAFSIISLVAIILNGGACTYNTYKEYVIQPADTTSADTGTEVVTDSDIEVVAGADNCSEFVPLADLTLNPWTDGNVYTFTVSDEQRLAMDGAMYGYGDQYGFDQAGTYADNVQIQPVGTNTCSNTGKVGLELVGQSSWRDWDGIPNFHIDFNDFQDDLALPSGDTDLRLNNGQAESGIMREYVALKVWRALYYAPRTSFAVSHSNIWDAEYGAGSWAAYTAVQAYKDAFFVESLPDIQNVWEGIGDFSSDWGWGSEFECQWTASGDDCDNAVLRNAIDVIGAAPYGEGFRAATEEVIDWEQYFRYQCLVNLTGTWDNYSHNWNNVIPAFNSSGQMIILPYSTDISAEHPWYPTEWYGTDFDGYAYIPAGCTADSEGCYHAELEACQDVIDEFRTLDPATVVVDTAWAAMQDLGIERDGDEAVYTTVRDFYAEAADRMDALVQEQLDCLGADRLYAGGGFDTGMSGSPCGQGGGGF